VELAAEVPTGITRCNAVLFVKIFSSTTESWRSNLTNDVFRRYIAANSQTSGKVTISNEAVVVALAAVHRGCRSCRKALPLTLQEQFEDEAATISTPLTLQVQFAHTTFAGMNTQLQLFVLFDAVAFIGTLPAQVQRYASQVALKYAMQTRSDSLLLNFIGVVRGTSWLQCTLGGVQHLRGTIAVAPA
jgi:hypothetical protein